MIQGVIGSLNIVFVTVRSSCHVSLKRNGKNTIRIFLTEQRAHRWNARIESQGSTMQGTISAFLIHKPFDHFGAYVQATSWQLTGFSRLFDPVLQVLTFHQARTASQDFWEKCEDLSFSCVIEHRVIIFLTAVRTLEDVCSLSLRQIYKATSFKISNGHG